MQEKLKWRLVSDVRATLLKCWSPFTGFILLIVVLQIIFGKYVGEVLIPIGWLLICFAPGSALLFGATWLNKFPKKLISPEAYRNLLGITLLHCILALLSILMMPFALQTTSAGNYLLKTLLWLSLSNGALITGYGFLFFRKENAIMPNQEIIRQVAENESKKAQAKGKTIRQHCLELIANGDLQNALPIIKEQILQDDDKLNQVILIESRLSVVTTQMDMNTIDLESAQIELNRITLALLNLSKHIK